MSTSGALLLKSRFHFHNTLKLIQSQSRFKQAFILIFALIFEAFLMLIFRDAFRFLSAFGGAGLMMISRLFALFFLGLAWMLILSSLVSAYSTFFGSPEVPFLLVRPFSMQQIVLYKFIQAAGLSSWAFLFVILPFVGAYAWHQRLSPLFLLWTLLFSLPFLFLFTGVGSLVVLAAVRWMPRPGKGRIVAIVLLASALAALLSFRGTVAAATNDAQFNLATMIPGMRMAVHPLSPGLWMADGIMALTRGQTMRGLLYLALLTATAASIGLLVEQAGGRIFYVAWQRARATGHGKRRPVLLPILGNIRRMVPSDLAAIMAKDVRTFFRDPVQWTQALVFFGLLGLYFSNLRVFRYDVLPEQWRSAITFLNIFAVSAVLSSLGSRFIFPQLSLEGHSFWLLGLSPATMLRILTAKFLLALVSTSLVSITLILIAARMLTIEPDIARAALAVISSVCLAVCGLSAGLGAVFLNLEERNPAAIVSSFGGTLNIVLCLSFMMAAILPFAILFHLREAGVSSPAFTARLLPLAYTWLAILTALTTALPLYLGAHTLQNRDF